MWGWDHGWGWGGWVLMSLMMIVFWTLVIAGAVWLARSFGPTERSNQAPLRTLEERFARGEIDHDEFEERRSILIGR